MGGEPLTTYNLSFVLDIIKSIKKEYPKIIIYLWTGYTLEELKQRQEKEIEEILQYIDVLIDGRFIYEQRDITLPLRGSSNQRILKKGIDF